MLLFCSFIVGSKTELVATETYTRSGSVMRCWTTPYTSIKHSSHIVIMRFQRFFHKFSSWDLFVAHPDSCHLLTNPERAFRRSLPGLTSSKLSIYASLQSTLTIHVRRCSTTTWLKFSTTTWLKFSTTTFLKISMTVVVKILKFRSMLSSKFQNLSHVAVEISTMFDTVDTKYPWCRRLRRYLSMLRRYSTLFIHGLTSKFLKTYVEITSNMDK